MAGAVRADERTFEQASIDFIGTYFQQWSSRNPVALAYMNDVFPNEVSYFDKTMDHASLMDAKRRFAERWPERRFTARGGSLNVVCDHQHLCTVWGLVDWACRSEQRHESATGTSAFSFQLQDGMAVISEDGFVVSRGQALMRHVPDSGTETVNNAKAMAPDAGIAEEPSASGPAPVAPDHGGNYTNDDIPGLRTSYFAQSSDRDWIKDWLMAEKRFVGTARSQGPEGVQTLSDINGGAMHVMPFDTNHGPIACMIAGDVPAISKGSDVRIKGIVSIFIDQTMYLAHCSFS